MQSIYGKVAEFPHDALGRVNGFVLEGGEEVRSSVAQLDRIAAIITPGSRIGISGDLQSGNEERIVLNDAHLTNLDLKQTLALPAPVCQGKPGMLLDATPSTTASLALHQIIEKAAGLLQAAFEAAQSAEHICRRWYAAPAADPQHHMILSDWLPQP